VTATELVEAAIARIEALNPTLNAVITPMFERALDRAAAEPTGPFGGVPFLVKDLALEVKGERFCEGSRFLRDYVSHFDSELTVRFERAGLIILGKTNTPEFGMAPACEPVAFGATRNPWDLDRSTSGSSGGSSAAVASGMVAMAHANDLGGSIRFPASACGLFGLKPTRARNPMGPEYGDVSSGWAVEHVVTRSVRDSARLLDATAGPAPGDPYWAPPPARPFADEVGADPGRLRIAFTPRTPDGTLGHPDCIAALDDAVALCTALGHEVVEADLPGLNDQEGAAIGTVFNSVTAWVVRYWVERIGREPEPGDLDPLTAAYNEMGSRLTAADYLVAIERLQRFGRRVAHFLAPNDGFDAFLTPTMSEPPAPLGEMVSTADEPLRSMERSSQTVRYAGVTANITGNPAMSVPLWWNDGGLPIGVHFLGRFGDEATLFRLASQLESARPWTDRLPPFHATST
jgi:amidase